MSATLERVREALAGTPAWLVGGAVRDLRAGRPVADVDLALEGDVRAAAKAVARATSGAPFALSDAFGAWRVVARDHSWQVDLVPLQGGSIEADLALRDFTVNAMAQPLAGGDVIDPHGGVADLAGARIRMVSAAALAADPLRTLRAARLAVELGFGVDPATGAAVREHAGGLAQIAGERIFAELKRLLGAEDPVRGVRLAEDLGVAAVVLPELLELRGVEQNEFHHRDVHDHTLEVLEAAATLERAPQSALPEHADAVRAHLAEPFADGLSHGGMLRWAALLHDIAKPATRGERPDGRVTFLGHDAAGAEQAAAIIRRLRGSEKLAGAVAALTRHHLTIGFLIHERPLSARAAFRFLRATAPYPVDVVLVTVADRLATRGRNAETAIAAHLEVASDMLGHAFAYTETAPLVRGDEVARAAGMKPGPWLAPVLERVEEERYAGELSTREEALERARALAADART